MTADEASAALEEVLEVIRRRLREHGIELDSLCAGEPGSPVKVVCLATDLKGSVEELDRVSRDQVVMVRVDQETLQALDAWVETGAVKSRSEAAALFIREGLKVRAAELEQLEDALHRVREAKRRLREKAREVMEGESSSGSEGA